MHLEKVMKFTNPLLLGPSATVVISVVAVLVNVVPTSFALSTAGRHTIGIIQKVNAQAREAELLELGKEKSLKFTWDKNTRFLANILLMPRSSVPELASKLYFTHISSEIHT